MFKKSLKLKKSFSTQSQILSLKMHMCDWDEIEDLDFLKNNLCLQVTTFHLFLL